METGEAMQALHQNPFSTTSKLLLSCSPCILVSSRRYFQDFLGILPKTVPFLAKAQGASYFIDGQFCLKFFNSINQAVSQIKSYLLDLTKTSTNFYKIALLGQKKRLRKKASKYLVKIPHCE